MDTDTGQGRSGANARSEEEEFMRRALQNFADISVEQSEQSINVDDPIPEYTAGGSSPVPSPQEHVSTSRDNVTT